MSTTQTVKLVLGDLQAKVDLPTPSTITDITVVELVDKSDFIIDVDSYSVPKPFDPTGVAVIRMESGIGSLAVALDLVKGSHTMTAPVFDGFTLTLDIVTE